ncbi:MAG: hypothetical protein CM15mP68_0050 [Pseudomonadota bacterium]|nr:MAG: hypothetical protein CM15mP68_0050 [Pseudomonadota bacterium]
MPETPGADYCTRRRHWFSGGPKTSQTRLVLGLSKMNQILHVDEVNSVARYNPGSTGLPRRRNNSVCITRQTHPRKLPAALAGTLLRTRGVCTAPNTALNRHNVLGVRVGTSDGEVLEIGGAV